MADADKLGIIDAYESKLWELTTEPDTQVAEALDVIECCQRIRAGLKAERESGLRWRRNPDGKWQFA